MWRPARRLQPSPIETRRARRSRGIWGASTLKCNLDLWQVDITQMVEKMEKDAMGAAQLQQQLERATTALLDAEKKVREASGVP